MSPAGIRTEIEPGNRRKNLPAFTCRRLRVVRRIARLRLLLLLVLLPWLTRQLA